MADDDFFTEAEWERYPEMEDLYDDMSETEFEPSDIPDEVPEVSNCSTLACEADSRDSTATTLLL